MCCVAAPQADKLKHGRAVICCTWPMLRDNWLQVLGWADRCQHIDERLQYTEGSQCWNVQLPCRRSRACAVTAKVRWHTEMCRGDTSKHRERVGMSTRSTASADTIRCQHGEIEKHSACVPCWLGLHIQTHIAVGSFVQPTPIGCAGGAARPRDLRPLPAIWQWAGHQTRSAPCGT